MSTKKKWFVVKEGYVTECEGVSEDDDPDIWYFSQFDDSLDLTGGDTDDSHIHVDDLFEDREEARQSAIRCCERKIGEYQRRLQRLLEDNED